MEVNKKELKEQEIRTLFITPALQQKGWAVSVNMREEYYFTDGRVLVVGNQHSVAEGKKADYLLYHKGKPIAVVEAKDNKHAVGGGIQQAMDYAQILDLKFAYSSNGDAFLEHDFITGKETEIKLENFPTEEELYNRYLASKNYTSDELNIIETPFYYDAHSHEPRYYQRIAVDRTVEAIARGQQRVLVVMATGTGKTFTAFQIIHRLHKSGAKKKILYLADRNILIDQTMVQDFKPFKKFMTKITSVGEGEEKIDSSYEVYMALYHQLVGKEGKPDPFLEVQPNFFDLIIVDECHRGSAKDDSAWRKVLEYFSSATQIGMTATPKADEGANNLDYFGEPVYTYSLLQGIQDGFLAPYRVTADFINVDLQGWTPDEGEIDLLGKEIEQKLYQRQNIGRDLAIKLRRKVVAHRITQMLYDIGRMTKTIVFCSDIEEAAEMRTLLINMNSDLCKKSPYYVTWKIQCKLPPKTKRFCPLKTFNNAPLKSLDRWGYYYFSLFPSVCSHFTDTFSCQLNPVRRMYNTIHNGICYCRVSDCIIPIVRWQLRGDDDGLAPMSVLYYIEQDGSFLGIKVHKEEVIQYEQRAPFDSLEFRFQCAFYFCHLKRTHKFRSIRIICPYALLAGFIPHCCGKEALPGTG